MYKIAFVIPYFGRLPEYFSEWLQSARYLNRQEVDFLIVSDLELGSSMLPSNVKILKMTFQDFKKKIQSKFDFEIALETPYKICDFKPALGYIFEDELKDYDFWGNCDLDQVWGNVRKFLTDDILSKYEKILYLGHCSLYKNNERMKRMFMNGSGVASYKEVFSSKNFYAFDEYSGMIAILKKQNVRTYYSVIYADIAVQHSRITIRKTANYRKQLVYFHNGDVYRSYIDEKGLMKTDEFLYFHYQKKRPKTIESYKNNLNTFYLLPDKFVPFNIEDMCAEFIEKNCDYISDEKDKWDEKQYKLAKFSSFVKCPLTEKVIWVRRKLEAERI